jgi:hypothetical protein
MAVPAAAAALSLCPPHHTIVINVPTRRQPRHRIAIVVFAATFVVVVTTLSALLLQSSSWLPSTLGPGWRPHLRRLEGSGPVEQLSSRVVLDIHQLIAIRVDPASAELPALLLFAGLAFFLFSQAYLLCKHSTNRPGFLSIPFKSGDKPGNLMLAHTARCHARVTRIDRLALSSPGCHSRLRGRHIVLVALLP